MSLNRALHELTVAEAVELLGIGAVLKHIQGLDLRADAQINALHRIEKEIRIMASTIKDLAAKDAALASELTTFLADIQAKLNSLGSLSPEDQATVDQVSGDLDSFTAQLQANDPGAPAPTPTPNA